MQERGLFRAWAAERRPLVFGHRGGSGLAPENTLAAFDRGMAEGADGLELDVRLSRDGEVVVCHDATVDRTTDARGAVSRFTAAELSGVDAGYRFTTGNGDFPFRGRGWGVPRLRAVLERYRDPLLIVEMKGDDVELARRTVEAIRAAEAGPRTCLGGFSRALIDEVRRLEPGQATSAASDEVRWALYRSWVGLFPREVPYRALQVPRHRGGHRVVSPRFVRGAHRAGVLVQVWTVNREDEIARLLDWGVDGIITDRPDRARKVIGEQD